MNYEFCATCLFGLEGPLADEMRRLGLKNVRAENGRVKFTGDGEDLARASIWLRCAERLMLEIGSFEALTFDQLFEGVKALPLENYFSKHTAFPVKGHCISSNLHSVPDCQSIIKKAAATRLGNKYGLTTLPEDGETVQIRFSIMKDVATIYLDASGDGLHKRGYRPRNTGAPLRETLAAAMVYLSRYRGREDLCDPFCGSGTIPVEAALIAKNRAPGLGRSFAAEEWKFISPENWRKVRAEAPQKEFDGNYRIFASDILPEAIRTAESCARRAGVEKYITFEQLDATAFDRKTEQGIIITNPPYGERMLEKSQAEKLYTDFGSAWARSENWKLFLLSSHTEFERCFGKPADKKRKLYNGMLKCDLFMYSRS